MLLKFQYLAWYTVTKIRKQGLLGLIGLAIGLCCCLFYVVKNLTQQNNLNILNTQLKKAQLSLTEQATLKKDLDKSNHLPTQISLTDVEKFYAAFSNNANLPIMLEQIRVTAQLQNLVLTRGDYKLNLIKTYPQPNQKHTQLAHYELIVPITGTYQQVRTFIDNVLFQLPTLGLSDVQIKRENTLSPEVNASLSFLFLLQVDTRNLSLAQRPQL